MASFVPREPYSAAELQQLYPAELELRLVQVLMRHGERTPVSARFRNAGLHAYWPYCSAARRLTSTILESSTSNEQWTTLQWQRRLENFSAGGDDSPTLTTARSGSVDAICQPGELTDVGRQTTLALGQRLRHLYVTQLAFLPPELSDTSTLYLRATPIPRALESLQQAFQGLYPPSHRSAALAAHPPAIITRSPQHETLYPNDDACARFAELSRAFAERAASRWNSSDEVAYISRRIGKWMPPTANGRVAVDSKPRLSGIMDTISATDAHGPDTKLPKEFYDSEMRRMIDQVVRDEWFAGYGESREYRQVGIGALVGDVVERMVRSARQGSAGGGRQESTGKGEQAVRFALAGCHDTTLAATLSALGAFAGERWPPFTSHIAIELFRAAPPPPLSTPQPSTPVGAQQQQQQQQQQRPSLWSRFFGLLPSTSTSTSTQPSARTPLADLSTTQRSALQNHYVRVRYNDRVMTIPGCRPEGRHHAADASLCTLEAFKAIVDDFTPRDWRVSCRSNLGKDAFAPVREMAGEPAPSFAPSSPSPSPSSSGE